MFHLYARAVYAALDQEHNRNRRPAEWNAVVRKLMTLDFVLSQPTAQFWATERDKTALLQELTGERLPWPTTHYGPRRGGTATTRYFADKTPWFREPPDHRLWFTYVNAERTLAGFETFLRAYAPVLAAVPSGVCYVGIGACRTRVEPWFAPRHGRAPERAPLVSAFLDYCARRRQVDTNNIQALSVADINRFRELRVRFSGEQSDDLYRRWLRDGDASVLAGVMNLLQVQPRPLRVHELGFRYDPKASRIHWPCPGAPGPSLRPVDVTLAGPSGGPGARRQSAEMQRTESG
jgi:hypothetical protein